MNSQMPKLANAAVIDRGERVCHPFYTENPDIFGSPGSQPLGSQYSVFPPQSVLKTICYILKVSKKKFDTHLKGCLSWQKYKHHERNEKNWGKIKYIYLSVH